MNSSAHRLRARRSRIASRLTLVLAAVLLPVILGACSKSAGGPGGRGGMQMPPMPVEVSRVEPQTVRDAFEALGSLDARESIEVVAEAEGTLQRLIFAEGQPVRRGALLAVIDDREIRAETDRAAAVVEQARANHRRAERLFAEKAIAEQELERWATELKVAEANLAVSRARLEKTRVRAAFSGMVGRRRVSPGAYLRTGTVITELAHVDEMRVQFAAPEKYTARLRVGAAIEITSTAYPGRTFEGRIAVVDPIIDPETRTVQLVGRVPNPDRLLKSGMSANVTAVFSERDQALTVPDEAVFAEGDRNFVFVVNPDSSVRRTNVQLGTRSAARVEVVSGLEAGQLVVRAGHQKLFEGARVLPVLDDADASAAGPAAARVEKESENTAR